MLTVADMIWISKAKSREIIKKIHKMLSYAGEDKVLHYIGNAYDMTKMKKVVKVIISACKACQKNNVEFTMNATIQKTVSKSSAELLFGRKICRERWISNKSIREKIPKKEYLTKKKFQIGDEVLVKVET